MAGKIIGIPLSRDNFEKLESVIPEHAQYRAINDYPLPNLVGFFGRVVFYLSDDDTQTVVAVGKNGHFFKPVEDSKKAV